MLGVVLLAATAAQAEDRKCIREMHALTGDDDSHAPMRSEKLRHQSE